jgi:zinc transport system substrate-binding protein
VIRLVLPRLVTAASVLILLAAVPATGDDGADLTVVVSILPQLEIAERIGGESVSAMALVPPGSFPATYEPTPKQMAALVDADLWVRIGIPFENAIADRLEAAAPEVPVVDGCAGIRRRPIDGDVHGGHAHGSLDPHIWLDPSLAATHAEIVSEALCRAAPDRCAVFSDHLETYRSELEAADARNASRLAPHRGTPIFVFHPAYGYFADRYGLVQVPVEVDGKVPTGRRLAELVDRASAAGATALFVQPQFAGAGAHAAADAMGVEAVEVDPLARDLIANLERIAAAISGSLQEQP